MAAPALGINPEAIPGDFALDIGTPNTMPVWPPPGMKLFEEEPSPGMDLVTLELRAIHQLDSRLNRFTLNEVAQQWRAAKNQYNHMQSTLGDAEKNVPSLHHYLTAALNCKVHFFGRSLHLAENIPMIVNALSYYYGPSEFERMVLPILLEPTRPDALYVNIGLFNLCSATVPLHSQLNEWRKQFFATDGKLYKDRVFAAAQAADELLEMWEAHAKEGRFGSGLSEENGL